MAECGLCVTELRKWFVLESAVLGGECVLVVNDEAYLDEARAAHPDLVVYSPGEVRELLDRNTTPMFTRRIHMIKKVFEGEIIPQGPRRLDGRTSLREAGFPAAEATGR